MRTSGQRLAGFSDVISYATSPSVGKQIDCAEPVTSVGPLQTTARKYL